MDKCPGCREAFQPGDIMGWLPDPETDHSDAPRRRWHLRCHQDAYYRAMERHVQLTRERYERQFGGNK